MTALILLPRASGNTLSDIEAPAIPCREIAGTNQTLIVKAPLGFTTIIMLRCTCYNQFLIVYYSKLTQPSFNLTLLVISTTNDTPVDNIGTVGPIMIQLL